MVIRSADSGVLIDLAVNAPPDLPASATPAGPTLAPEELAGNKLLALFDRAAARDFADIYILARYRHGLRRQGARRHDGHPRPVHRQRDTCRARDLQPPDHDGDTDAAPVTSLATARIRRHGVLGGLIHEYKQAA